MVQKRCIICEKLDNEALISFNLSTQMEGIQYPLSCDGIQTITEIYMCQECWSENLWLANRYYPHWTFPMCTCSKETKFEKNYIK